MKNTQYISAGAGSGKTYRLTHLLASVVAEKKARPEQVILTTFTKAAATEFRQKAKEVFYEAGLTEEAEQLDRAKIGTVHSVAESFVKNYWYLLGISPEVEAMAEEDTGLYIRRSMASLPEEQDIDFFKTYKDTFNKSDEFWLADLQNLLEKAVAFEVSDFTNSKAFSIKAIQAHRQSAAMPTAEDCRVALEEFREANAAGRTGGAQTARQESIDKALKALERFDSHTVPVLKQVGGCLKELKTAMLKKTPCPHAVAVREQLDKIWLFPAVCDLQIAYIERIYALAERWRRQYEQYKRDNRLIDFNDMEQLFFKLLQRSDVQADIRSSFTHLFVDEFQDSSPIQVKIFDCLSNLMQQSYFVGDAKQAIYGFRGSDAELTAAVAAKIEALPGGRPEEPLSRNYRSTPALVEFANNFFVPAFSGEMSAEKVRLEANRTEETQAHPLQRWTIEGTVKERMVEVARRIAIMIRNGEKPEDIAVLSRRNTELEQLAPLLAAYNIPVAYALPLPEDSREKKLVLSLLALLVDNCDMLARANILRLTQEGADWGQIIDSKLAFNAQQTHDSIWLDETPLIAKLQERRTFWKQQSIRTLLEGLIVELDLHNVSRAWNRTAQSESAFRALIDLAAAYEERQQRMAQPATISGFITYATTEHAQTTSEGVTLSTIHSAKGLEWKHVILLSAHWDFSDKLLEMNFYDVQAFHLQKPTDAVPYPESIVSLIPWIYGESPYGHATLPDNVSAIDQTNERAQKLFAERTSECRRLLYVAVTRARDSFVLVEEKGRNISSSFCWPELVQDADAPDNVALQDAADFYVADGDFPDDIDPQSLLYNRHNPIYTHRFEIAADAPREPQPRDITPSDKPDAGSVEGIKVERLLDSQSGGLIPLKGAGDSETMRQVGDCVHAVFAAIENVENRESFAAEVVKNAGLSDIITNAATIVGAWDRLAAFLQEHYGEGTTVHEHPFKIQLGGQIATGDIDLLLQTNDGVVIVDFKTYPGYDMFKPESEHYAGRHASQLNYYAKAVESAGLPVRDKLIYYPVTGMVVRLA